MSGRMFVVDILVNATGAVLILFFLLILRLSPSQSDVPPLFPNRSVMWIDVSLEAPGDIDRLGLRLWHLAPGRNEAVLRPGGPGQAQRIETEAPSKPFGPWGSTRHGDMLRTIVPCPATRSEWQLSFNYPADGNDIILGTTARVSIALSSTEDQALRWVNSAVSSPSGSLLQAIPLQPGEDAMVRWQNISEASCD